MAMASFLAVMLTVSASVATRPYAITSTRSYETGNSAQVTGPVCDISDYGAKPDNETDSTPAIQQAIDNCSHSFPDGFTVVISEGAYKVASLELRSHMRLHLVPGAGLYGSSNPKDYAISLQWFGGWHRYNYNSLLHGANLTNITVTGSNTNDVHEPGSASIVDGVGWTWWCQAECMPLRQEWCNQFNPTNASLPTNLLPEPHGQGRPRLINIYNSTFVTLAGFTAQNSPQWTIHIQFSTDVFIQNMTVLSPRAVGNTDGIDPESCERVLVQDSHVDVGDDGISIKSYNITIDGVNTMVPCNDVVMRRMVVRSRNWCIGSGTFGGVYNVVFEDSEVGTPDDPTNPVPWAFKFKSHEYYPGSIENITVRRIRVGSVGATSWMYPKGNFAAFQLGLTYKGKPPTVRSGVPHVRNVTFEDIRIDGSEWPGGITGLPEACMDYLTFRNVSYGKILNPEWNCQGVQLSTFVSEDVKPPMKCTGNCQP